jgi:hypothetical protein
LNSEVRFGGGGSAGIDRHAIAFCRCSPTPVTARTRTAWSGLAYREARG